VNRKSENSKERGKLSLETPRTRKVVEDDQEFLIIMIIIRGRRGTTKERRGPIP